MPSFLESLGRSSALRDTSRNLLGTAISIRRMQNEEASQERQQAIDLKRLSLLEGDAKIRQAAEEREATKFNAELVEKKRQDAWLDTDLSVDTWLGPGWQQDPARKMLYDKAKAEGVVREAAPGVEVASRRNVKLFAQEQKENYDFGKQVSQTHIQDLGTKIRTISEAAAQEQNPKKKEALDAQKKALDVSLDEAIKREKAMDVEFQKKKESKDQLTAYQEARLEQGDRRIAAMEERAAKREAAAEEREKKAEAKGDITRRDKIRREVEKIYGISDFLPQAQDPEIRRKYNETAALAEDVSKNPEGYGLQKDAGEAEIAQRAYNIIKVMRVEGATQGPAGSEWVRDPKTGKLVPNK